MADVLLTASPLAPGAATVRIHYREFGAGLPLLLLHGGWGYDTYPFDRQIDALSTTRRIIVPDRTGYGGSGRLQAQKTDFHRRAAAETFAVIDALELDRPVLWGHSDGAVIALLMGLDAPGRLGGLIVEATHMFRNKPASREFFETMRDNPEALGARVTSRLAREHGDGWRHLLAINGTAWLQIAADPRTLSRSTGDLYDGRLSELRVPMLVIHGARDPRTEPGELEALRAALAGRSEDLRYDPASQGNADVAQDVSPAKAHDFNPAVRFEILPEGSHSPHSERATADEVTRLAARFLRDLGPAPAHPAVHPPSANHDRP